MLFKCNFNLKSVSKFVALLLLCGTTVHAERSIGPWSQAELLAAPKHYPSDQCNVSGVSSILYEGLNYKGKPSRFYAYYGVPAGQAPATGWPGVVLVHGGGGTASASWVRQWNAHGYVAISMDL